MKTVDLVVIGSGAAGMAAAIPAAPLPITTRSTVFILFGLLDFMIDDIATIFS